MCICSLFLFFFVYPYTIISGFASSVAFVLRGILWNKLPPSLRVPCQSATSECSPPSPGSDSAPKSVVGVSHGVFYSRLKTHLFSRSFPHNLPLSLSNGLISRFLSSTCTEVSGVENIGQCGRLSQLSWLLLLLYAVTHAPFHAPVLRPTSWPNARKLSWLLGAL